LSQDHINIGYQLDKRQSYENMHASLKKIMAYIGVGHMNIG
jgi:hypothetical protein